jgi:hypothetical protein
MLCVLYRSRGVVVQLNVLLYKQWKKYPKSIFKMMTVALEGCGLNILDVQGASFMLLWLSVVCRFTPD